MQANLNKFFQVSFCGSKRVFSEEHRRHLSEAMKGRKLSQEHRDNLSKAMQGREITHEHREKISKSMSGRVLNSEHKKKISDSMKISCAQNLENLEMHSKAGKLTWELIPETRRLMQEFFYEIQTNFLNSIVHKKKGKEKLSFVELCIDKAFFKKFLEKFPEQKEIIDNARRVAYGMITKGK